MTLYKIFKENEEKYNQGYYTYRFEYTEKKGERRYEVYRINDGGSEENILKIIVRHISEYGRGVKLTDVIENEYFKRKLQKSQLALIDGVITMVEDGIDRANICLRTKNGDSYFETLYQGTLIGLDDLKDKLLAERQLINDNK